MSESLTLARRLSALDDDALCALLSSRQVTPRDARDFFDLADLLLSPASVRAALRTIDRPTLEALASNGSFPDAASERMLTRLGLLVPDAGVPLGVREQAADALEARPLDDPASGTPPIIPADAAVAGERAFTAVSAVAEMGHQLRLTPAKIRAHGGLSASDEKRFAAVLGLDPAVIQPLLEVARAAGLVQIDADAVFSTTLAEAWGELSPAARWFAIATAWLRSLPTPVRRTLASAAGNSWLSGESLRHAFSRLYPAADAALLDALPPVDAVAAALGLTIDGAPTVFGADLLRASAALDPARRPGSADPATPSEPADPAQPAGEITQPDPDDLADLSTGPDLADESTWPDLADDVAPPAPADESTWPALAGAAVLPELAAALPAEVDRVYLQDDLTIIAPGPLAPPVDARIRSLADLENRGVASSYRVSRQSVDRALASAESEASLREFLGGISLTGIPQALDYLLTEGGRRHGLVRVGPARVEASAQAQESTSTSTSTSAPAPAPGSGSGVGSGTGTRIRSADATLLAALAVDQSLAALGLRRDEPGGLISRADSVASYWLLLDAGYPVLAVDAAGEPRMLRRARILDRREAPPAPSDDPPITPAVVELVARLRQVSVEAGDDEAAWVGRELGKAVRARTPVIIEVSLPDGTATRLEVTPLSFANGRLRCVDVRAGVERTVPVANILSVTTA
ncbi:helicase-associated domain-containing protein [Herbiconiux sp.]|uniref:helicase-associated domain-containing protein n=1 Tax=Herbiconiux sp. TaxID=1871186 RepID=UPI0025BC4309|nr:helicase-associated domain-containing protein [Herbiconiux sp.]